MTNKSREGMMLNVLRSQTDCTNGGISSRTWRILVVGPGIPEIFEETPDCPAFVIGERLGYKFLRPAIEGPWYMMGGNYATSSDGRWEFGALPIHDRTESAELSRQLSI